MHFPSPFILPPRIGFVDLTTGAFAKRSGLGLGVINGIAVDTEDNILCTDTSFDSGVQFYDLNGGTNINVPPGATQDTDREWRRYRLRSDQQTLPRRPDLCRRIAHRRQRHSGLRHRRQFHRDNRRVKLSGRVPCFPGPHRAESGPPKRVRERLDLRHAPVVQRLSAAESLGDH